eukprot:COSAG01_NODE_38648_length_486_cov_151.395349_1_plen_54_part_10
MDWAQVERRESAPPFLPRITGPLDISNIDSKYTALRGAAILDSVRCCSAAACAT